MSKPKISIITINRNNAAGLKKTIESVVSQSSSDYEYIVIDGASTDESLDVIKHSQNKLTYWISEPDLGIYNAMNKGILKATGDYCLFVNSGDYLYNNDVIADAIKYNFIEDIVYGTVANIDPTGNSNLVEYPDVQYIDFDWFIHSTIPHGGSFIKRELFEKVFLYSENFKIVSDWEFFLVAICKYNCTLKKIQIPIYYFDTTGISSDVMNKFLIGNEREMVLNKHFSRIINPYNTLLKQKSDFDNYRKTYFFKIYKRLVQWKKK